MVSQKRKAANVADKKPFTVEVQASATVKFTAHCLEENPEAAREYIVNLLKKIDSGMVSQSGEFNNLKIAAWFEVTEAPKLGHDFELSDIEVTEDDFEVEE